MSTKKSSAKKKPYAKKKSSKKKAPPTYYDDDDEEEEDWRTKLSFTDVLSVITFNQNGTKESPYLVPVDMDHPERNVAGFDFQMVENMRHGPHQVSGLHVRTIGDDNWSKMEGTIPTLTPDLEELYGGCIFQIRRWSVPSFFEKFFVPKKASDKRLIYHKKQGCGPPGDFDRHSGRV